MGTRADIAVGARRQPSPRWKCHREMQSSTAGAHTAPQDGNFTGIVYPGRCAGSQPPTQGSGASPVPGSSVSLTGNLQLPAQPSPLPPWPRNPSVRAEPPGPRQGLDHSHNLLHRTTLQRHTAWRVLGRLTPLHSSGRGLCGVGACSQHACAQQTVRTGSGQQTPWFMRSPIALLLRPGPQSMEKLKKPSVEQGGFSPTHTHAHTQTKS